MNIEQTAEYIIDLYRQHGHKDYIGEPVSQLEHMCQCAQLAEAAGADEEMILAAFFHDIGHLCDHVDEATRGYMDNFGLVDHEWLGHDLLLRLGFSRRVCKLVASHVQAKRYLTCKHPEYYLALSEASKETLRHQGGPMNAEEASQFESDTLFEQYIQLRKWDEQAKLEHLPLPTLNRYHEMIIQHLNQQQHA
jgi:phosphonate degradation associated HDIG domain protein